MKTAAANAKPLVAKRRQPSKAAAALAELRRERRRERQAVLRIAGRLVWRHDDPATIGQAARDLTALAKPHWTLPAAWWWESEG